MSQPDPKPTTGPAICDRCGSELGSVANECVLCGALICVECSLPVEATPGNIEPVCRETCDEDAS